LLWLHFNHHVVAIRPNTFDQTMGKPGNQWTRVDNPEAPFILDPFHRDFMTWYFLYENRCRNVKVLTLPEFTADWPYWIDGQSMLAPTPGSVLPPTRPQPLPLPQGPPPPGWWMNWPSRYPGGQALR
jgi:hypothetical protein